jgi:hypothetical protein
MPKTPSTRTSVAVNLVLLLSGTSCLVLLSYLLYHYELAGDRAFRSVSGPLLYYGLPGVLAIMFFSGLRWRTTAKVGLALGALVTSLILYAAEVILDAVKPNATSRSVVTLWGGSAHEERILVELVRRRGGEYDTRSHYQVVRDLRAGGGAVTVSVYPIGFLIPQSDSSRLSRFTVSGVETVVLGGSSNRVTVFCNHDGEWITYRSDEHGFHTPPGMWGSERLDVVAVGGSHVQGVCVPSSENVVSVIRARRPATLNLGMANTGPLMALATLKEYATLLRPQHVLFFFYGENDLWDLSREHASPLLMRYLEDSYSQGLRDRQSEVDSLLEVYVASRLRTMPEPPTPEATRSSRKWVPSFLRLPTVRARLGLTLGESAERGPAGDDLVNLFGSVLAEAQSTVRAWNGSLYLVYLPAHGRYVRSSMARQEHANRTRILALADSLGIPTIDIDAVFEASGDPLALFPFRRLGHYNEAGHRLIGETVLRTLALE